MTRLKKIVFVLFVITCYLPAQGADKYTDENRPYEFGFSIDGEQHRHEKKDKNGIIMGEFGFITADGVYHVTVYATDENGKFKILSMKNIRVKPYPGSVKSTASATTAATTIRTTGTGIKKGHSLQFPPAENIPASSERPKPQINDVFSPAKSCSHCKIPTTTSKPIINPTNPTYATYPSNNQVNGNSYNLQSTDVSNSQGINNQKPFDTQYNLSSGTLANTQNYNNPTSPNYQQPYSDFGQEYNQNQDFSQTNSGSKSPYLEQGLNNINAQNPTLPNQGFGLVSDTQDVSQEYQNPPIALNNYNNAGQTYTSPNTNSGTFESQGLNNQGQPVLNNQNSQGFNEQGPKGANDQSSYGQNEQGLNERNPKQIASFTESPSSGPIQKPVLVSAQMQIVDRNTDIYYKKPGEQDGLPNGVTKPDVEQLLYTFNYTVGFHGHFEEGYSNGVKKGYYFITGRNGVRTRVDYTADADGFHPRISQDVLDLLSDDVPKPETEKDEKYGLKGYEFKWLYFPVGSRR